MKNPHKHHIIPRYRCKELGIDPDFLENIVEVDRLDHALIHWGYKCDDLEPLFEYITPAQWIIDLIPRGDNRDIGAAVLTAKGELDEIEPVRGEEHPNYGNKLGYLRHGFAKDNTNYKHGRSKDLDYKSEKNRELYWKNPEEYRKKGAAKIKRLYAKWKQDPKYMERKRKYEKDRGYTREEMDRRNQLAKERRARKKAEAQGVGNLKTHMK